MPVIRDRSMVSTAVILGQMEDEMLRRQERLDEIDMAIDDQYLQRITDEVDSQSPIYDRFLTEQGSEGILIMTNFSHVEFETLFALVEPTIMSYWGVGRGRRYEVGAHDAFFIALNVLKRYSQWDMHAKVFGLKTSSFEKMVMKMLTLIEEPLKENFIKPVSMTTQRAQGQVFKNYPYALYATDVKFQEAYRPSGRFIEAKRYFSGKHYLYGLKLEASVALPGVCVSLSGHHPGSVHDNTIFTERKDLHTEMLTKNVSIGELAIEDNGEGSQDYSRSWGVLVDMGYQGSGSIIRTIQPKRKPRNDELTNEEIQRNKRVSSDRILVENYFGRMSKLWSIMSDTFRWSHDKYDMIATISCALTNYHTSLTPLIAQDGSYYNLTLKEYIRRGQQSKEKRSRNQAAYRRRRANRINLELRSTASQQSQPSSARSLMFSPY
jgi:hypothetical protein